MCDIYGEYCKVCGEGIGFHLGDFNTERFEVTYICSKHTGSERIRHRLKRINFPYCVWSEGENQKYLVISLTQNAWKNRHFNHQNLGKTEILEEVYNSSTSSNVQEEN